MRSRPVTGRSKSNLWLASTSIAALMIGGGTPPALAAPCVHTVTAAFDNPAAHTTANVCVRNTSFTGNITNEGTISPSGIAFVNGTITGFIGSTGVINGGISLDGASRIGAANGITIFGPTLTGGISNAGTISGTVIGVAVFGTTSFGGGIVNNGTIRSTGVGVLLQVSTFSGGISLGGAGTITAGLNAIEINGPGTFLGGITNAGTITSTGVGNTAIDIAGTLASFGGGITNTGTISATGVGINVVPAAFSGGITNAGTISAKQEGILVFVSTFAGGISNSGTIASHSVTGLFITGTSTFTGGITNSGTITSAVNAIGILSVATFMGGISNGGALAATTADGIVLNTVSTFAGGITNAGSISANIAIGAANVSTFAGGIVNAGTGRITAAATGILVAAVSNFSGGIVNAGSITSATRFGVMIFNVSTFAGGFTNSGTISAQDAGVVVNVSTFLGGMTNSGTIASAGADGLVAVVSTFAGGITNTGTITAATNGIFVAGVAQFVSGGVTNAGSISAKIGVNVRNDGTFAGGILNAAPGRITTVATGIALIGVFNFAGGVSNAGTITSATKFGVEIDAVSIFAGGVTNTGSISAHVGIEVTTGVSMSGGILNAGTGTITAAQTGLALINVSNFSGGVTNAGAITSTGGFGINIRDGSTFSGGFTNSGTIRAHSSGVFVVNTPTFLGGMTNSGTISAANGSGMYAFTVSTFTGGMTNTGTISAGGGWGMYAQSVAGFSGGMLNSGTITAVAHGIAVDNVPTFSGGITNIGSVSVAGGTGIFVNGVSTLAGGITNTGTVSGAHGIFAFVSTSVSLFDSGTIIGTSGNAVTFGTGPNTLTLGPGYNIQGDVVGSGTDILQLGGTGSGNFNLATIGGGAQYRGFTTFNVVGGVWNTTGTFGQIQAWNVLGGTLAGTGTFQSINVGSGGTLEPGTPGVPGTFMTANGNLTFAPGAIYAVQLSPTTASRINVAGNVSLNGSVEGFLAPGTYAAKKTYDILDPASITGTFTGFTAVNAPGFTGTLTYNDPTDVLLTLTMNLGLTGMNGNQQNVATAINNTFNNGGSLPANFFPLTTLSGANLGNALMQIDGEAATGAERSAFQSMTSFLNLMLDPFVDGRNNWGSGGYATGFAPDRPASFPPAVALAYDSLLKAPPAPSLAPRWNAWAAAYGGSGTANGNPTVGSSDITAQTFGYAAGVDYHVTPDALLGFALAGGGTNWGLAQGLGGGRSDAFQAGLYGKTYFGPAYLAADVGFANHWFTTTRTAFAGDQLTAKFDGQSYGARFEGGYRFGVLPTFGVTPYAAVQAQSFHTPSYSETDLTGGGFGLTFNAMTATDTRSELGARFDDWQVLAGMPLIVRGRIAWAHDWVSNPALSAVFEALPGSNFIVNGAAIPKDSALTSVGAEWRINTAWSVSAKFDGEFASGAQTYAGTGVLRYTW